MYDEIRFDSQNNSDSSVCNRSAFSDYVCFVDYFYRIAIGFMDGNPALHSRC